jgi:hypothetical protein
MVMLLTEIMQLSIIQGCFYSTLDAGDWSVLAIQPEALRAQGAGTGERR